MVDAASVVISLIAREHPEELPRRREWERLAKMAGIEIEEDEALKKAEIQRGLAAAMADFGMDD